MSFGFGSVVLPFVPCSRRTGKQALRVTYREHWATTDMKTFWDPPAGQESRTSD